MALENVIKLLQVLSFENTLHAHTHTHINFAHHHTVQANHETPPWSLGYIYLLLLLLISGPLTSTMSMA